MTPDEFYFASLPATRKAAVTNRRESTYPTPGRRLDPRCCICNGEMLGCELRVAIDDQALFGLGLWLLARRSIRSRQSRRHA
jgi:hypothetical protein